MKTLRVLFALALVSSASVALASNISGGGGGGTVPGPPCGDATHAIGWNGSQYICQAITGSATPGGTSGQLQYSNSGALGGISGVTSNGTLATFANGDLQLGGSGAGVTTFSSANVGTSNFTLTLPAATDTVGLLAAPQAFTNKTYNGLSVTSTTGTLSVASGKTLTANASLALAGTDGTTMTFPVVSDTMAALGTAETFTAAQTFQSGKLITAGATSGNLTIKCAAACGTSTLAFPAGTTDFSATGGLGQVVEQTSAGGAFTVARLACADLSNAGSGCSGTLPASANPSATVGLTAVNGTAATYMTSDSVPALSQSISPVWTGVHTFAPIAIALPTAVTEQFVPSVSAGQSNTAGANITFNGSQGTGTGAGGTITFQLAPAGSSGVAQNGLASALKFTTVTNSAFGSCCGGTSMEMDLANSNEIFPATQGIAWASSSQLGGLLTSTGASISSVLKFCANALCGGIDTGLSRDATGVIDVGSGAAQDKSGQIDLTTLNSLGTVTAFSGTAVPAGGTTGKGFNFSSATNLGIYFGSGAPTLSAAQGSLYIRTDGSSTSTRLYVNTNGTTGWTSFSSAT